MAEVLAEFNYTLLDDGTYEVTCSNASVCTNAIIPSTYQGVAVTSIGYRAFYTAGNLKTVTIPASIKNISPNAFYYCTFLINVAFEKNSSLTTIGNRAFMGCLRLPSIEIPASVTTMEEGVLRYCEALKEIIVPSGVTSIGNLVFSQCTSLEKIIFTSQIPATLGTGVFEESTLLTQIIVHKMAEDSYKTALNWSAYASLIVGKSVLWLNFYSFNSENKKYISETLPIEQDLSAVDFTPIANTYYKHIGSTTTTFTKDIIYFYNGTEFKAIDGSGSGSGGGGITDVRNADGTSFVSGSTATIPNATENVKGLTTLPKGYELIEKIIVGYSVLTEQPDDWETNYASYYKTNGKQPSDVGFGYVALTELETWESGKYYSYNPDGAYIRRKFEPDGTPYNFNSLILAGEMRSASTQQTVYWYFQENTGTNIWTFFSGPSIQTWDNKFYMKVDLLSGSLIHLEFIDARYNSGDTMHGHREITSLAKNWKGSFATSQSPLTSGSTVFIYAIRR